jgi:hypothetical protein
MSVDYALQKRAGEAAKGFDKVAAELDRLAVKIAGLQEAIWQCNMQELGLVADLDTIVYYNDVTAARFKHVRKEAEKLRKVRMKSLEELAKARAKAAELRTKCEMMSYRQGELLWDAKIEAVKKRKWKS